MSVLKVLALVGVLGWILYIATLVLKGRVNRKVVGNGSAPSWKHSKGKGPSRYDLRARYRQLNMIGFENDAGEEEEWKTCTTYKEKDLIPHKKVSSSDYPSFCLRLDSFVVVSTVKALYFLGGVSTRSLPSYQSLTDVSASLNSTLCLSEERVAVAVAVSALVASIEVQRSTDSLSKHKIYTYRNTLESCTQKSMPCSEKTRGIFIPSRVPRMIFSEFYVLHRDGPQ